MSRKNSNNRPQADPLLIPEVEITDKVIEAWLNLIPINIAKIHAMRKRNPDLASSLISMLIILYNALTIIKKTREENED